MNSENVAHDGQTDTLTGVGSRVGLSNYLNTELHRLALLNGRYQDRFLCCDIDDFKTYVDYHGFPESDKALIELAGCLKNAGLEVYRIGGDEFVARGAASPFKELMKYRKMIIRQTIVEIDLPLDRSRLHRCRSWILAHLQIGIVQPKVLGDTIKCLPPPDWTITHRTIA